MRLLTKNEVQTLKNADRKREIDEGVKLAKKVDTLRKTSSEEESRLRLVREASTAQVLGDIARLVAEKTELEIGNSELKAERLKLEAPIDLTEAWDEVDALGKKNESIADELLEKEITITKRESDVEETLGTFSDREKELARSEESWNQNLLDSENRLKESITLKKQAQELFDATERESNEKSSELERRERSTENKEADLEMREKALEEGEKKLTNEKILLADRRATLERGFAELRRKMQ